MTVPDETPPAPWAVAPVCRITEPVAVELLWHPARRIHLRPFLGRACGLSPAAAELGLKKTAMSYWIDRLLEAGLIRPWTPERRGRRALPRYRCIADRLVVSLRDAPAESHEAVFDDVTVRWRQVTRQSLGRSLARQAPWLQLEIDASATGGLRVDLVPSGPGAPPDDYQFYWGRLWLTPQERDAMRQEIDAVWERYAGLSHEGGKPCPMLLHLVSVPDTTR